MIFNGLQPTIHHIAYLVTDTHIALTSMRRFARQTECLRRPLESQQTFITFLECGEGEPMIELVEPFESNFAMKKKLECTGQNSILYHIGYMVANFDDLRASMRKEGWLPLSAPFEGFNEGCRALHLFNPAFGILELMELPESGTGISTSALAQVPI